MDFKTLSVRIGEEFAAIERGFAALPPFNPDAFKLTDERKAELTRSLPQYELDPKIAFEECLAAKRSTPPAPQGGWKVIQDYEPYTGKEGHGPNAAAAVPGVGSILRHSYRLAPDCGWSERPCTERTDTPPR